MKTFRVWAPGWIDTPWKVSARDSRRAAEEFVWGRSMDRHHQQVQIFVHDPDGTLSKWLLSIFITQSESVPYSIEL